MGMSSNHRFDNNARGETPPESSLPAKKVLVIGTTGLSSADDAAIAAAAKSTAIVRSPNMSLAVNLVLALTERVAATLEALAVLALRAGEPAAAIAIFLASADASTADTSNAREIS